jgi:glutathione S-transferase
MISTQPQMLLQKSLQHQDIPAGKALSEKAIKVAEFSTIFTDLSQYQKVLGHVELILDEIETELGSEKHLGPWLCGPTFSAADICLVSSVPFKSMVLFRFGIKILILSATILGVNFVSFVELC